MTPAAPPSAPCNNGGPSGPNAPSGADLPSIRAGHDLELAAARLRIAQAALQAEQASHDAMKQRLNESVAPLFKPMTPVAPPKIMPKTPSDDTTVNAPLSTSELQARLEETKKALSTLSDQVAAQKQMLEAQKKAIEELMKRGG
jgi:hypothetical protein